MTAAGGRATNAPARCALSLAISLAVCLGLAACAGVPSDSESLWIETRDYGFVDEVLRDEPGRPSLVEGHLLLPGAGAAPHPTVVLLHGARGLGALEEAYAERLAAAGYAVLLVDSFGARGVETTVEDQTLVSAASMLADAYGALGWAAADPRFDGRRVALLGFSKGGTAALYAANARLARALAPDGTRFAAHAAHYPWCGLSLQAPQSTGAPILLQIGGADEVTRADYCRRLLDDWWAADPGLAFDLVAYPEAGHAFDHPLLLATFPFGDLTLPIGRALPNHCRFLETAPGEIRTPGGEPVTAGNLEARLAACSGTGAWIGGDSDAAAAAARRLLDFLARAIGG